MNYEDILKIICDSLRYPEFVKAFENLNQFEQKELCEEIERVMQSIYNEGYEDCEDE